MTKKIHQHLGLTQQEYEFDCYSQYMRWCQNLAKKQNVAFQSILANNAIANYYQSQFLELQHQFKLFAQRNDGHLDYEQMMKNYEMIMVDIYTNYPSALVEAAKKLKIENQISSN